MRFIFVFIFFVFLSMAVNSQTAKSGIVHIPPYTGAQPELIQGISIEPAVRQPLVRHVYRVAPNILAITIDEKAVLTQPVRRYIPQPEDRIELHGPKVFIHIADLAGVAPYLSEFPGDKVGIFRFIYRSDQPYGWIVTKDQNMLMPVQTIAGDSLITTLLDEPQRYSVSVEGNENSCTPKTIHRKSRPHGCGYIGPGWDKGFSRRHDIYLEFAEPLPNAAVLVIRIDHPQFPSALKVRLCDALRSEAIHINLLGFVPKQRKTAQISTWLGNGNALETDYTTFQLVDCKTDSVVFCGALQEIATDKSVERHTKKFGKENFGGTFVYQADFSRFQKPGRYTLVVPGLGSSFPFEIAKEVWKAAFEIQMLGFLHQRSGIKLGPPETALQHPRNLHPADRPIYNCNKEIFFNTDLYSDSELYNANPFYLIQKSLDTTRTNQNGWGGWADATDFDRRINHLRGVHQLLDCYESNPEFFQNLELSLPECDNNIPDILDEALWCTELFRRTQTDAGEIIYGIESIDHPRIGETSWWDSLPWAVVPGNPHHAYQYAAVAARMALLLMPVDSEKSTLYRKSAERAFHWAEAHLDDPLYLQQPDRFNPYKLRENRIVGERSLAAFYLGLYTGEPKWRRVIEVFLQDEFNLNNWATLALIGGILRHGEKNNPFYQKCLGALLGRADKYVEQSRRVSTGHPHPEHEILRLVQVYGSDVLIYAHQLTREKKYLQALEKASQYGLGANPLNLCYTSGIGERFNIPRFRSSLWAGLPWPAGIPAYGPYHHSPNVPLPNKAWGWDLGKQNEYQKYLFPKDVLEWPFIEQFFNDGGLPALNEYTVHEGMADQLFRWGYLAQYYAER